MKKIPQTELEINFVRSGGPGGQNVNKVNTKAEVRWKVKNSKIFSEEEKQRLIFKLKNRINKQGELISTCNQTRDQARNKNHAIEKLEKLVDKALVVPKKRKPTKKKKSVKEKERLSAQKERKKKSLRKGIKEFD